MKKILVLSLLMIMGCHQKSAWIIVEGNTLELQYNPFKLASIDEEDFFWIDDLKIIHEKKQKLHHDQIIALPTGRYYASNVGDTEVFDTANLIKFALYLHHSFEQKKTVYASTDPTKIRTQGKITLYRKDSQPIRVKYKPDYPLRVTVVK